MSDWFEKTGLGRWQKEALPPRPFSIKRLVGLTEEWSIARRLIGRREESLVPFRQPVERRPHVQILPRQVSRIL